MHPLIVLAIAIFVPLWALWAIRKSIREGVLTYDAQEIRRTKAPLTFWMAIAVISIGIIGPIIALSVECDRVIDYLSDFW